MPEAPPDLGEEELDTTQSVKWTFGRQEVMPKDTKWRENDVQHRPVEIVMAFVFFSFAKQLKLT